MEHLTAPNVNAFLGLLLVCGYYSVLWFRSGGYDNGPTVTQYRPPRDLSPAMLRFVWKERFDDRTFWAAVLSLVSKDLASLEHVNGEAFIRPTGNTMPAHLPREESILLKSLFDRRKRTRVPLNVTDSNTVVALSLASQYLHKAAVGRWFRSNYRYLLLGVGLSLAEICITASPRPPEEVATLLLGLGTMTPGGYYGFFVLLRIVDFLRAVRGHVGIVVLGRVAVLVLMMCPCLAALVVGGVVLGITFGHTVLILTAGLIVINLVALLWLKFPTKAGRQLLNEIEGFREFLLSVERLPQDRIDAPGDHVGLYEKYLPYAVALEVEQSWCDQFVALRSAFHEREFMGVRPFYLGMWDGEPVEVVYARQPGDRY